MTDVFLDLPPDSDQIITELHAWIATHPDGSEGIISHSTRLPGGSIGHMPLISSKASVAARMRQAALQAVKISPRPITVRLARFKLVAE